MELKPGTQIIYVPYHAHGDIDHRDAQAGFVTSVREDGTALCRYFYKDGTLRTAANSERCDIAMLVVRDTRPQSIIDELLPECIAQAAQTYAELMTHLNL